jgi:cell division protein ZapA
VGQLVVKVNGRDFALVCADGQEPRLRGLAQYVDAKVGDFAKELGQVGEARLIVLAALAIADELSDANDALEQERNRARGGATEPNDANGETTAASGLDEITRRIEAIAARMEAPQVKL